MTDKITSDTLKLAQEIVRNMPYSYWASTEPWKIFIMTFTVMIVFSFEPTTTWAVIRYEKFREWVKGGIEDNDLKLNISDMLDFFIILGVWMLIRIIVIAATWHMLFAENQVALIIALGGVTGTIITLRKIFKDKS